MRSSAGIEAPLIMGWGGAILYLYRNLGRVGLSAIPRFASLRRVFFAFGATTSEGSPRGRKVSRIWNVQSIFPTFHFEPARRH